jgi:peptidoglycan/xylan/chitin deacetylase (PgdA/CDA1 family)
MATIPKHSRRTFLALAGISLLSACSTKQASGGQGGSAPLATPVTEPTTPAAPPSPPPTGPPPNPLYEINAGEKAIALTIDDGPDGRWTPEVLDILAQYNAPATFFMIGSSASDNPDLVRAIADGGHELATHTWSHKNLKKLPPAQVRSEIERAIDAVTEAGGVRPTAFRAPYGNWSSAALSVCHELGQRPWGWSVDPEDWAEPGIQSIVDGVLSNTGSGSIILNHDGGGDRSQTVAAIRTFVPQLIDQGYRFVTVQQGLGNG